MAKRLLTEQEKEQNKKLRQAKLQIKKQQAEAMNRLLSSLAGLLCSANDADAILNNAELAKILRNHVAEIKEYLGVTE